MNEQQKKDFRVINGNSLEVLDTLAENSVDAIITDPPYELGFMGKKWDSTGIAYNVDLWKKALKVLKPGAFLLAFGGSRTYHRIACAIEDAGFEIRDTIMWIYGVGFPKSMNIGLAIDKRNGVESEVVGTGKSGRADTHTRCMNSITQKGNEVFGGEYEIKQAQNEWAGWGTCLKPAFEPIIVARKPCEGSILDNVLKYRVGGINIDECRVDYNGEKPNIGGRAKHTRGDGYGFKALGEECIANENGRFPANVILTYDETDKDEVCGGMLESNEGNASRYFYCAKASKKDRDNGLNNFEAKSGHDKGNGLDRVCEFCGVSQLTPELCHCPTKSWIAKPKKNIHPTVKPVELMQYLVRLVSPKGATILDIFNGSGSTGKAVAFENRERNANYKYIGIELEKEYCDISIARIDYALNTYQYDMLEEIEENKKKGQLSLFDFEEDEA